MMVRAPAYTQLTKLMMLFPHRPGWDNNRKRLTFDITLHRDLNCLLRFWRHHLGPKEPWLKGPLSPKYFYLSCLTDALHTRELTETM